MEEEKPEKSLKTTTVWLMISTAIFFDALQWLLAFVFMDWLVTIFAYMTFWLWFVTKGIRLLTPKRFAIQTGTLLIEVIPFVAMLPAITCMVVLTIINVKLKEHGVSLEEIGKGRAAEIRKKNKEWLARIETLPGPKLSSRNPEAIRAASQKRSAEFNAKMERDKGEWEERKKQHEESRQRQRKDVEDYGGYKKYDKDLAEIKYKHHLYDEQKKADKKAVGEWRNQMTEKRERDRGDKAA